jgi:hypothetical protein
MGLSELSNYAVPAFIGLLTLVLIFYLYNTEISNYTDGQYLPGTTPGGAPNMATGISYKGKPVGYGDYLGSAASGRTVVYDQKAFNAYDGLRAKVSTDNGGLIAYEGMYDCGCGCNGAKSAKQSSDRTQSFVSSFKKGDSFTSKSAANMDPFTGASVKNRDPFTGTSVKNRDPFTGVSVKNADPFSTRLTALDSTNPDRQKIQLDFDKKTISRRYNDDGATGVPGEQWQYGNAPRWKSFFNAIMGDRSTASPESFGGAPGQNLAATSINPDRVGTMGLTKSYSESSAYMAAVGGDRYAIPISAAAREMAALTGNDPLTMKTPEAVGLAKVSSVPDTSDKAVINPHYDAKVNDGLAHAPKKENMTSLDADAKTFRRDIVFTTRGEISGFNRPISQL